MRFNLSPVRTYWLLQLLVGLLLTCIFTVSTLFRIEVIGLSPLQLVLVGTMLEASYFLLEVPTGIIADTISRRLSVLLALGLFGCGAILEAAFPSFLMSIIAQFVFAIGYACMSGALEAWVADESDEPNLERIYLRGTQAYLIGSLVGIGLAMILARLSLRMPMLVGGASFIVLSLGFGLIMRETHFHAVRAEERNTWHAFGQTLKAGFNVVRGSSLLVMLMLVSATHGASSEGLDRLWQKHVLENLRFPAWPQLQPIDWFGLIGAASIVVSFLCVEAIKRWLARHPQLGIKLLGGMYASMSLAVVGFALAHQFGLAVACYLANEILRRTSQPLYSAWLNRSIPSNVRATVISISGQANAFGQMLGGPLIGWVASGSLRVALVLAGCALLPASWLVSRHGPKLE